jgi:hypothetical protein
MLAVLLLRSAAAAAPAAALLLQQVSCETRSADVPGCTQLDSNNPPIRECVGQGWPSLKSLHALPWVLSFQSFRGPEVSGSLASAIAVLRLLALGEGAFTSSRCNVHVP